MTNLAAIPVLAPFAAALLLLIRPLPGMPRRLLAATFFSVMLAFALTLLMIVLKDGALVLRVGDWPIPFGIALVADALACIMVALSSFTALACVLYGFASEKPESEHPLRLPLVCLLTGGINLSFVTGDLFNLFVAFEVMLIASYALMTLETCARDSKGALPYLTINLVGSALFLAACGYTYGLLGTLNFAEMIHAMDALSGDPRLTLLGLVLLVIFGIKAGMFPLYYWLPGSYRIMPPAVSAFYAGMLTKVGVYVLIRLFGTILPHSETGLQEVVAVIAGLTMIVGVLGAVSQSSVQVILSYHIVSQIGFMVLAIGLHSVAAFTAAIVYIIHHIVVKASLFLAGGVIIRRCGTDDLEKTGGLWRAAPWLGILFLLQSMSLAGLPPLSGFWGKLMIVQEGFVQREWVLVAASLVASLLTTISMLKIWMGAFWKASPTPLPANDGTATRMTRVGLGMAVVSLAIGLAFEPVLRVASVAAQSTFDRAGYSSAVFEANKDRSSE